MKGEGQLGKSRSPTAVLYPLSDGSRTNTLVLWTYRSNQSILTKDYLVQNPKFGCQVEPNYSRCSLTLSAAQSGRIVLVNFILSNALHFVDYNNSAQNWQKCRLDHLITPRLKSFWTERDDALKLLHVNPVDVDRCIGKQRFKTASHPRWVACVEFYIILH